MEQMVKLLFYERLTVAMKQEGALEKVAIGHENHLSPDFMEIFDCYWKNPMMKELIRDEYGVALAKFNANFIREKMQKVDKNVFAEWIAIQATREIQSDGKYRGALSIMEELGASTNLDPLHLVATKN